MDVFPVSLGFSSCREWSPVNRISMHHPVVPQVRKLCFIWISMGKERGFYAQNLYFSKKISQKIGKLYYNTLADYKKRRK